MSAVKLINAVLDMKKGFRTTDFISPRRKSLIRPPRRLDTRVEWEIWTVSEVTSKLKWRAVRYIYCRLSRIFGSTHLYQHPHEPGGTTQAIILPSSTDRVVIRELIYFGLHHTSYVFSQGSNKDFLHLLWICRARSDVLSTL
ncbi:unnamed protein product [Rhizoctonia solani]|uniref:Uncharacterized protein n=1 Tax=Rhizoctonia solani TaxID=456999 RepID=A0A8H3B253_9AGAM|nr:unnamed protein product [Rhizoctonia solani]